MRVLAAATLFFCLLAQSAFAQPAWDDRYPSWGNRMTGFQKAKQPRWGVSRPKAAKRHIRAKNARMSPAKRRIAPHRAYLAGVVAPLAAKAREIEAACGSRVISAVRYTRIAGTGGRLSLHASGRAIDIVGNPKCIYEKLNGWPGGVSTDYGRVNHVHFSYAPGGPEWGVRFQHHRGHKRRRS